MAGRDLRASRMGGLMIIFGVILHLGLQILSSVHSKCYCSGCPDAPGAGGYPVVPGGQKRTCGSLMEENVCNKIMTYDILPLPQLYCLL